MNQRRFSVYNWQKHVFGFTISKKQLQGTSISMRKHEIKLSSRTVELLFYYQAITFIIS